MIASVPFVVVAVVFAFIKPHRKWCHNLVDVLLFLLLSKICICMHIIFETIINDYTLRVLVLMILIEMVIPQLVVIIYFFKLASWRYLQHLKQLGRNCTNLGVMRMRWKDFFSSKVQVNHDLFYSSASRS